MPFVEIPPNSVYTRSIPRMVRPILPGPSRRGNSKIVGLPSVKKIAFVPN